LVGCHTTVYRSQLFYRIALARDETNSALFVQLGRLSICCNVQFSDDPVGGMRPVIFTRAFTTTEKGSPDCAENPTFADLDHAED
jgi:hypothetical protein